MLVPMTEADEIIAEAGDLPLKDAAFLLWRECAKLDLLAWRAMPPPLRDMFRARPASEHSAEMRYEHDHAEDGLTFDRLKLTHPGMDDTDVRHAIIAAVKFDDACFGYFRKGSGRLRRTVQARGRTGGTGSSRISGADLPARAILRQLLHEVIAS
jgi:hypothetical protein